MDFTPPESLKKILPEVRAFIREKVHPLESAMQTKGFHALQPELEKLRGEVRGTGLFTPHMGKEYGGAGLSLMEFAHLAEELGRSPLGHYVFNCQAPDAGNMEVLAHHGTAAQKERFLKPLVRGEIRSCFGMTEPEHAGSNPAWLGTRARREGDVYVVDGHKWFTSGAEGASFCIVMAVTDPESPNPYLRASQIIVPMDTPGFRRVRNIPVAGEPGEGWASHAEVMLEHCRVPVENRLGEEGMGFVIAQDRLGPGRIHHCMRWLGICERAFDLMCERAASRQLSPGKPLGTRQMVQEWIADSRAEINAARLMVLHAAWKMEKEGAANARDEISTIKFFAANVLQRVLDRAIQTHGAMGLTDATPLAFWWGHERGARIYDGADEVHKSSLARRILERYGLKKGREE
ncbi:acyl-CoA dehydrogenase family protein [Archangium sp.]|uniref:acyl-CoA dehydrogenase family protein n=1 Tax=Archangium sp. TaxID=1872627 RepID=UPI002D5002EA|nr:acyl-CoA dehydrogenase family protein [Archangium sp.]HYO58119.1 acyl-CoA dehydrogenase family protein [Archangium sp.]